jgi:NADH-quinone oxidoreductase subunit F
MKKITDRLASGRGQPDDVALLTSVADNIAGKTICAFGEACAWPVQSFVGKFRNEFESHALGNGPAVDKKSTIDAVPAKKMEHA